MSTFAGLHLLQADMTSPIGKRILIFATDLILDGMNFATINIILMDGTFKVAPPQFMQIWIIRVRTGSFLLKSLSFRESVIFGVELFKKHYCYPVFDYWTLVIRICAQNFILFEV